MTIAAMKKDLQTIDDSLQIATDKRDRLLRFRGYGYLTIVVGMALNGVVLFLSFTVSGVNAPALIFVSAAAGGGACVLLYQPFKEARENDREFSTPLGCTRLTYWNRQVEKIRLLRSEAAALVVQAEIDEFLHKGGNA